MMEASRKGGICNEDTSGIETPTTARNDLKQKTISPLRFWLLCFGVCLGLFLSMLDSSIVATCIYTIGVEFKSLHDVNWVALAYTLASLGCAVVFSRISDVVGRRDAFIAAYVIFFGFSLACGFSQNIYQLIAFRALQGVGGSGLYSLTMIMLPEVSPVPLRHHIGSMIGMVIAISGVLGPVLGGVFAASASWRWVFWINGPVGAVSLAVFFLAYPKAEYLPAIERRSWRELDYPGSFLTIAAAVLVVFSFQNAGASAGISGGIWNTAIFIAPLVAGLICWVMLFLWQYAIQQRYSHRFMPAFPINLFRNRAYSAATLNTLFLGYPAFVLIYGVPLRVQVVGGKSALQAGVMLLPMLGTVAFGSIICGAINASRNLIFETLLFGSCLMLVGCGMFTTLSHELDQAKLLGFLAFCGLGYGLAVSSCTMIATAEAPQEDYAPAQGIIAQLRLLGGSLGIAASTAILGSKTSQYLTGVLTPQELATIGGGHSQLTGEQWQAVRLVYAEAFRTDMIAATAIAGAAVVLSLGAYQRERKPLFAEAAAMTERKR